MNVLAPNAIGAGIPEPAFAIIGTNLDDITLHPN